VRELPRGTVTFLFTDIEGSTRLLDELGAEEYARALAEHRRVLREAFERNGGIEVDTQGDAFFVAFPTAPGALDAAREAQDELELPVRMGLHTGTPLLVEEGYVGQDVHRAARIAAAGHGRQVLVSTATAALVDRQQLRDLGEHRLKDLSAPERIFQLGDEDFPRLKALYRTNLPIPATPFLGREHELADVRELLARDDARLLTLTGAGGSGKTRLALHAAGDAAEWYPDGVWWVPLAPLTDPADVGAAAAGTLGGGGTLPELVDGRRLLLLLDNFEHVVEAAPDVAAVLAECPHADVLVTSRERLRVQGEHVYPVPVLERAEARRLFVTRARAAQPDFEPSEQLDELCARLDDLPLALELAAARTSLLTTDQLLERLGNRLDVLQGGRDAERRQQTLRATIEWSYELLDPDERRLLAALSVFRGGWTLEAAEQIANADLELMQSLVDKSLVRRWQSGRFGMLETIREFAAERLAESGGEDAIRPRQLAFLTTLARRASLTMESPEPMQHALVVPERDNIRSALAWALARGAADEGLELACALENYWVSSGDSREGAHWFEGFLGTGPVLPELHAKAIRGLGNCAAIADDRHRALQLYERSMEEFQRLGDETGAAVAMSRIAFNTDDPVRVRVLGAEALDSFRRLGVVKGEGQILTLFGGLEREAGNLESAVKYFEQSIEPLRRAGFTWWEMTAHLRLAELYLDLDKPREARDAVGAALRLARRMDDRRGTLWALVQFVRASAKLGDDELAARVWAAAEAECERDPIPGWEEEVDSLGVAGVVRAPAGDGVWPLERAVEATLSAID
jgi:predicted ATPase/class 3 adenylate cyclase